MDAFGAFGTRSSVQLADNVARVPCSRSICCATTTTTTTMIQMTRRPDDDTCWVVGCSSDEAASLAVDLECWDDDDVGESAVGDDSHIDKVDSRRSTMLTTMMTRARDLLSSCDIDYDADDDDGD